MLIMVQARIVTEDPDYTGVECSQCSFREYEGDLRLAARCHIIDSGHAVVLMQETVIRPADQESAERFQAYKGIYSAQRLSEAVQAAERSRDRHKPRRRRRQLPVGQVYDSMDELVWSRKKR